MSQPQETEATSSLGKRQLQASSWWNEVEELGKYTSKGGAKRWKCKKCGESKTGPVGRVKAHLCHLSIGAEVSFCTKTTPDIRKELLEKYGGQEKAKGKRPAIDSSFFIGSSRASGASSSSYTPAFSHSAPSPTLATTPKQRTLATAWDPRKRENVDGAVARFFYHDHIAFNVARSPYFLEMVKEIASFGPSYRPPSYERIRTTLLEQEKQAIQTAMRIVQEAWEKNGVTLIADGWSDNRSRSIHGIVAYSRGRMQFLSSHDASATGKSATQLVEEWSKSIDEVGAEKVIQLVCDGEPSNRAAGARIEIRYPHITFTPCFAHCLSNLLKDIGGLPWVEPLLAKGKEIIAFIKNHHYILDQFRKRSPGKDLLKYSETRFGYNFLMMKRLYEVSLPLKQLSVSNEWTEWAPSRSRMGIEVKKHIFDDGFWEDLKNITDMMQPIMRLLRITDGRDPCIGKVYEGADRMIESLREKSMSNERYEEVRNICEKRWNEYHSPMHAAAYVLDPQFQGNGQEADDEVMEGWEKILHKLVPNDDRRRTVKTQLSMFRNKMGRFGSIDAQKDKLKVGATLWWEDYGSGTPELQSLAIRILSQTASSSPLEQLWSLFSHIHSKKRNKFGPEKLNDLVYVSANLRLLSDLAHPKPEVFINLDEEVPDDVEDIGVGPSEEAATFEDPLFDVDEDMSIFD